MPALTEPMSTCRAFHPLVDALKSWLVSIDRFESLDVAVKAAHDHGIPQLTQWDVSTGETFLLFADCMLHWVPTEGLQGKEIYAITAVMYFVLGQPQLADLKLPLEPTSVGESLRGLDIWMADFSVAVGSFMDSPESLNPLSYKTIASSWRYNLEEADIPEDGFDTFNELFSRRLKTGMRPIHSPEEDSIICWPADCTFAGHFAVSSSGNVAIPSKECVTVKTLEWPIEALLDSSPYAEAFSNGTWMHAFLNFFDYHRLHAPVSGEILEARVVQGLCGLKVQAVPGGGIATKRTAGSAMEIRDDPGYQFLQTRGLVIIDNPILGKVAVLPVGMATVSSVILSLRAGQKVKKGDEMAYFQFGGSDVVLVFESRAAIQIAADVGQHKLVGQVLGYAYASPPGMVVGQ